MDIKIERTARGFTIGRFRDFYDAPCTIQKSSLAEYDCLWLGQGEQRMHLTTEMVASLIPMLQIFVETGELPGPAETI